MPDAFGGGNSAESVYTAWERTPTVAKTLH